jgi:hypothetical protein
MAFSVEELREMYPDAETRSRILELNALGFLMAGSIVGPKYRIPAHLHEPIVFTPTGESLVRGLGNSRSVSWGEQRMAVFLSLFHDELFVDPSATDIDAIRKGLSREIRDGKIKHPFIFDRELYDKAYDELGDDSLVALDPVQTQEFLRGTPVGIFQQGRTVVGPWGALQSSEFRNVPSTTSPPLYHCERPGCSIAHRIELSTSENRIISVRQRLDKKLYLQGAPSNWGKFLGELVQTLSGHYDDSRTRGVIAFLGECFTLEELRSITETALADKKLAFREICFSAGISIRAAGEFLEGKTKQQIMQLLLLLTDHGLCSAIEQAVLSGKVVVPEGEVRISRLNRYATGSFGTRLECSRTGVRVASNDSRTAIRRLERLVYQVYNNSDLESRLKWKIRNIEGELHEDKLRNYLATEDARKVIRELFLSGPDVFDAAADILKLGKGSEGDDDALVARISWRLGFPGGTLDMGTRVLRERVQDMRDTTPQTSCSDVEKERVRSRSVHLFVALEKSLDSALCFTTWLTRFDHWAAHQRFTYEPVEARQFMANVLTAQSIESGTDFTYDPTGRNTLGPLIAGFGLLASHLAKIEKRAIEFLRPEQEIPSVCRNSTLVNFGYPHTVPYLNFSRRSREDIIEALRSISRTLSLGGVLEIRNSLEHHREEFPSSNEILSCLNSIDRYCETIEQIGFIPLVFRMREFVRDSSGRTRYVYEDYSGRTVEANTYSSVVLTGMPEPSRDQILVPGIQIDKSDLIPRFSLGVRSNYTEMWSNWPRHRAVSRKVAGRLEGDQEGNVSESA